MTNHPFKSFTDVIAIHVRLGVIGCVRRFGLNQSTGPRATAGGPCTTGPIIAARVMVISLAMHRRVAIIRSGASLEVLSPSALAGRVALCRAAGLCTIPLRRFVRPPALCGLTIVYYALAVFRIAEATAGMLA